MTCGVLGWMAFTKHSVAQTQNTSQEQAKSGDGEGSPSAPALSAPAGKFALESKGYIIPAKRILVSPKVSGMMVKLNIEEGQIVAKGEVLGEIENNEYQAELDRAVAAKAAAYNRWQDVKKGNRDEEKQQAKAEWEEAKQLREQYLADWKRSIDLHKTGALTQQEFDGVETRYKANEHRIRRLESALRLMEEGPREERILQAKAEHDQAVAEVTRAQWRFDNCKIKAPISGTILKKNTEEGNIVNAIAFNGSFSVCDIADLSDLEVDMNIQERDISKVFVGQKCDVRAEAYPSRVYQGVVSRLMPIADRAKGAIPVRVKVTVPAKEQGQYLKPDMGAVVVFHNGANGGR